MQHLEGSGMPVLYIGRTVLKGVKSVVFEDYVCRENVLVCLSDGLISIRRICEMTGLPFLIKCGPVMVL